MCFFFQVAPVSGTWPRHFLVTPDGLTLVVANQFANNVQAFAIDQNDGTLSESSTLVTVDGLAPTIVLAVNA